MASSRLHELNLPSWADIATEVGSEVALRDQENRILVAIDDLVEFLNVMGEE